MLLRATLVLLLGTSFLAAQSFSLDVVPREGEEPLHDRFQENKLDVSYETGALFNVGSNATKAVAPQIVSLRWQLDDIGNEGWRRGNTEWVFSAYYHPVLEGAESRFTGGLFGPRYNFVQPNSKWIPFTGARVGFGFTDSTGEVQGGQGQDFFFTFTVEAGVRYLLSDHLDLSFMAFYQHISNAGLSEPERENTGLDVLGPMLSLHWKF